MSPATLPQYQPLARAPKLSVMQRYNWPLAWKHNMPPSCWSIKMRLCALETSNVSWITCCCAISVGAQERISEIRGSIMWFGMTVLEVTLLMELSTTKRGERPSAMTTPSLPTAVRSNCCLSSARPPGTWAMNPASNSSCGPEHCSMNQCNPNKGVLDLSQRPRVLEME